jgi:hypothetical protein
MLSRGIHISSANELEKQTTLARNKLNRTTNTLFILFDLLMNLKKTQTDSKYYKNGRRGIDLPSEDSV